MWWASFHVTLVSTSLFLSVASWYTTAWLWQNVPDQFLFGETEGLILIFTNSVMNTFYKYFSALTGLFP